LDHVEGCENLENVHDGDTTPGQPGRKAQTGRAVNAELTKQKPGARSCPGLRHAPLVY
jgi:hypothetical protein